MRTENILVARREDLHDGFQDIALDDIDYSNLRSTSVKPFQEHPFVIFVDEDGESKLIKNRYGYNGVVKSHTSRVDNVQRSNTWFDTHQIETFVGTNGEIFDEKGDMVGERRQLIVMHQNKDDKKALIGQLKTLIHGLENNFDYFASN